MAEDRAAPAATVQARDGEAVSSGSFRKTVAGVRNDASRRIREFPSARNQAIPLKGDGAPGRASLLDHSSSPPESSFTCLRISSLAPRLRLLSYLDDDFHLLPEYRPTNPYHGLPSHRIRSRFPRIRATAPPQSTKAAQKGLDGRRWADDPAGLHPVLGHQLVQELAEPGQLNTPEPSARSFPKLSVVQSCHHSLSSPVALS